MVYSSSLISLLACSPVDEKQESEEIEDPQQSPEDTGNSTDTSSPPGSDRILPDEGCELDGWLQVSGQEYYYFMQAFDASWFLLYDEWNDLTVFPDNKVDQRHWYTRDESGLLLRQEDDLNGNEIIDQVYEWVYTEGFYTEARLDNDNDGNFDEEWVVNRDDSGYPLGQTYDDLMDGIIDIYWTHEWNIDMTIATILQDNVDEDTDFISTKRLPATRETDGRKTTKK